MIQLQMKEQTKEPEQHNRHEPKKGNDSMTVPKFVTSVCCLVGASATQKWTLKKHIVPTQNEGENARLNPGLN